METARRKKITGTAVPAGRSGRHLVTGDGLTVEQFISRAVLDLKKIAPFFFAALHVIPRVETAEIDSIAVSSSRLYYNSVFVAGLTRQELTYYFIHDLYHIIMRHHMRGRGKDPVRWNRACDLYINKCISDAYGVRPGELTRIVTGPGGLKAPLCMPPAELYDGTIDVSKATPEKIYEFLPDVPERIEDAEEIKRLKSGESRMDLIDDPDSDESETAELQKSERIIQKIRTTYDQVMKSIRGRDTAYEKVTEAQIDEEYAPRVNWRALLQNRLVAMKLDERSLSHPDRRFVHTGLYVEGPVTEEEELSHIKICVDTSGSMGDDEVATALLQIQSLLRQYHAKAELVFWDEEIEMSVPFENMREFRQSAKEALGRGGTNPDCLFEAFSQRNVKGHANPLPNLVIIFTDGEFSGPDVRYRRYFDKNTIWIVCPMMNGNIKRDFDPGFGRIVLLKNTIERRHRNGSGNIKHAHSADIADYITA